MATEKPAPPKWIIARLGGDQNWWFAEASSDVYSSEGARGLLDPGQIACLVEMLDEYQSYGYDPQLLNTAFQWFVVKSELDDDRLRLAPVDGDSVVATEQLFALPLTGEEGTGPYYKFLDDITAARIRMLNSTHYYVRACTDLEMQEELDALDRDRYFASDDIHCFDEINEMLQWSPAEWDDPNS